MSGEVNGMPQPQPFFLLDKVDPDRVVPHNILFDLLAKIPDDNRCLIKPVFDQSVKNMADNGFAPDVQEYFGNGICVGT
jgi:hypothetical protein